MALVRILQGCCAPPHGVVWPGDELEVSETTARKLRAARQAEYVMVRAPEAPESAARGPAPETTDRPAPASRGKPPKKT